MSEIEEWVDPDDVQPNPVRDLMFEFMDDHVEEAAARVGRPLTGREREQLENAMHEQADSGRLDADDALRSAGVKSWGDMNHVEIAETMAARARDMEPDERWSPDREFDLSNRRDVDDYMTLRAQGEEFDEVE
jgi:hypothetical protein